MQKYETWAWIDGIDVKSKKWSERPKEDGQLSTVVGDHPIPSRSQQSHG
jgi:hypothetical protein